MVIWVISNSVAYFCPCPHGLQLSNMLCMFGDCWSSKVWVLNKSVSYSRTRRWFLSWTVELEAIGRVVSSSLGVPRQWEYVIQCVRTAIITLISLASLFGFWEQCCWSRSRASSTELIQYADAHALLGESVSLVPGWGLVRNSLTRQTAECTV